MGRKPKTPTPDRATVEYWEERITSAMKEAGLWSPVLAFPVYSLASSFVTLVIANRILTSLTDSDLVVIGSQSTVMHPAFKTQRDAASAIAQHLKVLGLTTDKIDTDSGTDKIGELLNSMR